jgi:hypothetical protein
MARRDIAAGRGQYVGEGRRDGTDHEPAAEAVPGVLDGGAGAFGIAHGPVLVSSLALGVVWATVSGTWFGLYVRTIDKARARAADPRVQRLMRAATGVVMLGLGLAVALTP